MVDGDATVNLNAFFITQLKPAYNLFKRAMAATAYIIPQHGGAMADTWAFRSDFLLA